MSATNNPTLVAISTNENFNGASFVSFQEIVKLSYNNNSEKIKIYVKFQNNYGNVVKDVEIKLSQDENLDDRNDDNDSNSDNTVKNSTSEKESNEGEVLGIKITRLDELAGTTKVGSRGQEVKELQNELKKLGFFPANIGSTGYYGPITSAAVKKYLDNKNIGKNLASSNIDDLISQLKPGSRGAMVQKLQTMLKDLKYFPDMKTTLYYGSITDGAVKKYQARKA